MANCSSIVKQTLRGVTNSRRSERRWKQQMLINRRRKAARRHACLRQFAARICMTTTFRIGRTISDEKEGRTLRIQLSPPHAWGGVRGGVGRAANLSPNPSPRAERGAELLVVRFAAH